MHTFGPNDFDLGHCSAQLSISLRSKIVCLQRKLHDRIHIIHLNEMSRYVIILYSNQLAGAQFGFFFKTKRTICTEIYHQNMKNIQRNGRESDKYM